MHTPAIRLIAAICFGAALSPLAGAQPAPPQLEPLEKGEPPAVTIRSAPGPKQIIEQRERGRVTSATVRHGNNTYEVKPNAPAGSAQAGDLQSDANRAPQWKVLDFDWSRDREREAAAREAAAVTPPPPELEDGQ